MSTLRRRVAAIVRQARLARVPFDTRSPYVRETLRGIGNMQRRDPRQAAALVTLQIQQLVKGCGDDLAGLRDRALILVCFDLASVTLAAVTGLALVSASIELQTRRCL